jgi:hypothetical protein
MREKDMPAQATMSMATLFHPVSIWSVELNMSASSH